MYLTQMMRITGNSSTSLADNNLDELLAQLNSRQVAKFEPVFLQVDNDDSDDDVTESVHEKR